MSALAAQQEQENKKGPSALDIIGGLALGAGIGALAGRGIVRGMRRGGTRPVTVQDLGSTGAAAEQNVRRAAAPPPSRPAPGPTAARQTQAEEFVRQARTERPSGIQLVNIQDLGNTVTAPNTLALLEDIEYESPYRKGPTYQELYPSRFEYPRISPETIQTRRQAAAQSAAAAREAIPATYQLELGGEVSPTLRQLRSSEFGPNLTQARREALGFAEETATSPEFSFIKSSIPLTEAPKQFNIFNYLEDQGYKESSSTGIPYQGTRSAITATTPAVEAGGDAADRLILEYQQLAQRQARSDQRAQASVREYQMRVRGAGERVLSELQQESLVDRQNKIKPFNVDQAINAFESGEDQMTGRIKQQLQRNEDLDLTQVELLEEIADANYLAGMEQDEPIIQVASRLPDGLPVDQVETARPLSSQELADIAKSQMIAARQELEAKGLRPGTQRFDRALAQTWTTKSMSGVQPGTSEFRRLQELGKVDISLPEIVRKAVEAVGVGPESEAPLPERTLINIGPEAQIETTAAGTAIRGAAPSLQEALPKFEQRQLMGTGDPLVRNIPLEMGQDIPGALRTRGAMSADIPSEELSKQEIVYQSLNRPATPEVPGGSAGIGVYGIEPGYVPGAMSKASGEYSAAASRKPTYVPGWLQKKELSSGFESLTTPQLIAGAEAAKAPSIKQSFETELQRRETAKESIVLSEMLRRARIEGRDPQNFVNQQVANLGVSAIGELSPYPRRSSSPKPVSSLGKKATPAQQALSRYVRAVGNPYLFD